MNCLIARIERQILLVEVFLSIDRDTNMLYENDAEHPVLMLAPITRSADHTRPLFNIMRFRGNFLCKRNLVMSALQSSFTSLCLLVVGFAGTSDNGSSARTGEPCACGSGLPRRCSHLHNFDICRVLGASFQLARQHPGLDLERDLHGDTFIAVLLPVIQVLKHFGFDQESAAVAVFTGHRHRSVR